MDHVSSDYPRCLDILHIIAYCCILISLTTNHTTVNIKNCLLNHHLNTINGDKVLGSDGKVHGGGGVKSWSLGCKSMWLVWVAAQPYRAVALRSSPKEGTQQRVALKEVRSGVAGWPKKISPLFSYLSVIDHRRLP